MTQQASFCLLSHPWILVRDTGGQVREVGIREAFHMARDIRGLVGEMPTQEAAILRLLLAILYRALPVDEDELPAIAWARWWEGGLPVPQVLGYLDHHADRFDLLDSQRPFFQVAGLRTLSGKTSGVAKLIAEIPDGEQYFTTRAGAGIARLTFAEAARWLVHCHAFDQAGIKSGAAGDPRVKGGKGYPIGTGWSGNLGLLIAEGACLEETLLLNLDLGLTERTGSIGSVPWERSPDGPSPRAPARPSGPADLLTWQARRIRLIHDGAHVVDALIANGDPIVAYNRGDMEPMTTWRFSDPQTRKLKQTTYLPLTHQPERALWRGLSSLLAERVLPRGKANDPAPFQRGRGVEWLGELRERGVLAGDRHVAFRAVGVHYGTQNSFIGGIIDDRLDLAIAVLTDPQVRVCATRAADCADEAVRALGQLAANLARAAGRQLLPGEPDGARERVTAGAFAALDPAYRNWVAHLSPRSDLHDETARWHRQVHRIVLRLGIGVIAEAGRPALIGREVNGAILNAARAEAFFRAALRMALPQATAAHITNQEAS